MWTQYFGGGLPGKTPRVVRKPALNGPNIFYSVDPKPQLMSHWTSLGQQQSSSSSNSSAEPVDQSAVVFLVVVVKEGQLIA
jgi:hypothetical protein